MRHNALFLIAFYLPFTCIFADSNKSSIAEFSWPNKAKIAVSLAYDDALESHLDNAIPALNKYKFRGSFYLTMNALSIKTRLNNWRQAAIDGHELGNHTLYHYCSASLPNRAWVKPHQDLDDIHLNTLVNDIKLTNNYLHAIDGETIRTYTAPCADELVSGQSYYPFIEDLFVGMKTHVIQTPLNEQTSTKAFKPLRGAIWAPHSHTGEQLIAHVEKVKAAALRNKQPKVANITFHGIGGDHLSVSKTAHDELLEYLASRPDQYWVDTYRNISIYVNTYKP